MREPKGLGELLQLAIAAALVFGAPLLKRLLERRAGQGGASTGPRGRSRAEREAGPAGPGEAAEREEELRRGRELFERLARGESPPTLEPAPPALPVTRVPPPRGASVPEPEAGAGTLAGLPAADAPASGLFEPVALDEESLARQAADQALARARLADALGRARESVVEARPQLAGTLAGPMGPQEGEIGAPESAPAADVLVGRATARARGLRLATRADLRAAVLAAELLGPPLALRADGLGPTSPSGLRPL